MKTRGNSARHGFTLVELLVVIVIIAILAGLLVVSVMAALRRGKKTAIRTEIMGMAAAMESYKNHHDHYPPSSKAELLGHVTQIHSRQTDVTPSTIPNLTPANALHFWLPGYCTNPQKPVYGELVQVNIDGSNYTVSKGVPTPFFDFDAKRLDPKFTRAADEQNLTLSRLRTYIPKGSRGSIPYVYFRKIYDASSQNYYWLDQSFGNDEIGKVFFDNEELWIKERGDTSSGQVLAKNINKDFVIISAGLESRYVKDEIITSLEDGTGN